MTVQLHLRPRRFKLQSVVYADWHVDSVYGSDSNDGTTILTPFATLAKLMTVLASGESVGLAKGSHWREQLTIPGDNCTIGTYGSGARPILDCSDVQSNAGFSKTGGYTNIYQKAVTIAYSPSEPAWTSIWEDDTRLVRATSLANCDATQGSYYATGESSTSCIVYVHASDSSSVVTNGKTYEMAVRHCGVYGISYDGTSVTGVHTKRNLANGGSLKLGNDSTVSDCLIGEGTAHNCYLGAGSNIDNTTLQYAYYTASCTMLVINEDTPADEDSLIDNCTFEIDPTAAGASLILPANSHNNVSGYFGTITLRDCEFIGFIAAGTMFGFNHSAAIVFTDCTWTNCKYGVSGPSVANTKTGCTLTVSGGTWSSTVANQRFFNCSTASVPIIINDSCTIYADGTTDTGYIYIGSATTVTVSSCTFNNRLSSGVRQPVYCSNASANLTVQYNTFTGSYDWSTNIYQFTAGASGMTWASNYNTFGPNFRMNILGTTYTSLATYQAATGQDANSTG